MNTNTLNRLLTSQDIGRNLRDLSESTSRKIVFSTSFGMEDQVITDLILSDKIPNIEVFTLDTGRLFPETYALWDQTNLRYQKQIKSYYPATETLENFINENGINPFYTTVELRKRCCQIRKVEPLKRALQDAEVWITGLRAEQSANRNTLEMIQWDEEYQLYKYNPLLHWTLENVKDYIKQKGIPYNPLHDKGFVSIGCAPCTRAIREGEDFRAGRWWWEDTTKKECGLHR
ncbi:phosphoadenylyl-sulfate reductase [Flavobacterium sp. '19STA2R22 D10 B1']|uniref:phosphoadenylyl-sulfate reductase n=1 Tax=Flavobacterium aerium TaxID=3037261 RepID=UPI00278C33FD|nr:phosphoadenylyl-sulfate reductase [Flavobacterium sp. '19STA2R22 D10 B1']